MNPEQCRIDLINGLREFAQFLEDHPNVHAPWTINAYSFLTMIDARKSRKGSAEWVKNVSGDYVSYEKSFGNGTIDYSLCVSKNQTCEKVQIGVKHIPEHDEPIYEWHCA